MKDSPILALMKEYGAPLTRDEYLKFNGLGKSNKVTPEEGVELPNPFQYPVVSHEELPEPKAAASTKGAGKPSNKPVKHFNGKVFKNPDIVIGAKQIANPKGITPMMDTDRPAGRPSGPPMNVSNPPQSDIVPNAMTPRE